MSFGLVVKTAGKFTRDIERYIKISEQATSAAVGIETNALKDTLRADIRSAGFKGSAAGLANAWRSELYPRGRGSLNAAGRVWSKVPKIVAGHDQGTTISAKGRRFLAIPSDNVPNRGGFRGARLTPKNWPARLGELQFVVTRTGHRLLIAQRRKVYSPFGQHTGYRKASEKALRTGADVEAVVMFFLVPVVKLRKRFDVRSRGEAALRRLPETLYAEKQKRLYSLR